MYDIENELMIIDEKAQIIRDKILDFLKEAEHEVWIMVVYEQFCPNKQLCEYQFYYLFILPLICSEEIEVTNIIEYGGHLKLTDYMLIYDKKN